MLMRTVFAMNSKSPDAPTLKRTTLIHLQPTKMVRAKTPFALTKTPAISPRLTTRDTALLLSPWSCTAGWSATTTWRDTSPTASMPVAKTRLILFRVFQEMPFSQHAFNQLNLSFKAHLADFLVAIKCLPYSAFSLAQNLTAMSPLVFPKAQALEKALSTPSNPAKIFGAQASKQDQTC